MGVVVFEIDRNFWEVNPLFKIPKVFKEIYDFDSSKKREESSRFMWALALMYDYDSIFSSMRADERQLLINRDYLNEKDYSFDKELVDQYNKMQDDSIRKLIKLFDKEIDEAHDVLYNTQVGEVRDLEQRLDLMKKRTDLMGQLSKLVIQKQELEKLLQKDAAVKKNRGGKKDSLLEDDKI